MEGQQGQQSGKAIAKYLAEQLSAGYSEARLRQHLITHGWSETAVNEAFDAYHKAVMPAPEPMAAAVRRYRPRIPKWTRMRFIKLGVSFAVITVLATGGYVFFWPQHEPPQAATHIALAYKQKQSRDIVLLAGVISRFIDENNGEVPTRIMQSSGNSLILCNDTCNPLAPEFSPFSSYKADNIQFVPYASGLIAPDKDTMYIVSGGTCRSATELGEQNVNPRAMVILYGRLENSGQLVQRCVTL